MILSCPSCSTRYFIDDAALGENGRTVRCASCGYSWFARPELVLAPQLAAPDLTREQVERERQALMPKASPPPVHTQVRENERRKRARARQGAAVAVWSVVAMIVAGGGALALAMSDQVVRYWPQSATAYAMIGVETNPYGLEFINIEHRRLFDGATPVLDVSGEVRNITADPQPAPFVRIALIDETGADMAVWRAELDLETIPSGEMARFESRYPRPPTQALDLQVRFTLEEDGVLAGRDDAGEVTPQANAASEASVGGQSPNPVDTDAVDTGLVDANGTANAPQ